MKYTPHFGVFRPIMWRVLSRSCICSMSNRYFCDAPHPHAARPSVRYFFISDSIFVCATAVRVLVIGIIIKTSLSPSYNLDRFVNLRFTVEDGASLTFDIPTTQFGPSSSVSLASTERRRQQTLVVPSKMRVDRRHLKLRKFSLTTSVA